LTSSTTDRRLGLNGGVAIKAPVRAATTANITLSGEQTIDGISVVTNDRVLVKDQTDQSENGIYDVSTSTWTRSLDFDGNLDVVKGTLVNVNSGTTNSLTAWKVTTSDPITIDSSNIVFTNGVFSVGDSSSITFTQSGTAPVTTDLQARGRLIVYLNDDLTSAQVTDYSGRTATVDLSTPISNILTDFTSGNIWVPDGTGLINSAVDLSGVTNFSMRGMTALAWLINEMGFALKAGTLNMTMIDYEPTGSIHPVGIVLEDICLQGNAKADVGVRFDNFSTANFTRLMLYDFNTYGFNLGDTNSSFGVELDTCYVNSADTAPYRINARHTFMRFCRSDGGTYGIDIASAGGQSEFIGNHIEGASSNIIRITSAANNRIIGNNLTAPSAAPVIILIQTTGANNNMILGNTFSANSGIGSIGIDIAVNGNLAIGNVMGGVENGIKLRSNSNIIIGNHINASTNAIYESSPSGANTIIGNYIEGGAIVSSNTGTTVFGNIGAYNQKRTYAATLSAGGTNDYNPSTYADIWFLAGDAAGTSKITGIAGGLYGREITITNVSAYTITIGYSDTNSSAANRIVDPSAADIAIPQYGSITLQYHNATSLWYVSSKNIA